MNMIVVDKQKQEKTLLMLALSLAWQLGYTIVAPLLIFGVGGRFLDRHFGTAPILFLIGLVVAVLATSVWLVVKLSVFTKDIHNEKKDHTDTHRIV